jgi:hypothetical protein
MKRGILAACMLMLTACFPIGAPADPFTAALSITPGASYSTVQFATGTASVLETRVELYAIGVRVNSEKCKLENAGKIVCKLNYIPLGTIIKIPVAGKALNVVAKYRRDENGAIYELTAP